MEIPFEFYVTGVGFFHTGGAEAARKWRATRSAGINQTRRVAPDDWPQTRAALVPPESVGNYSHAPSYSLYPHVFAG